MARSRISTKRMLLLSIFIALCFLTSGVLAQEKTTTAAKATTTASDNEKADKTTTAAAEESSMPAIETTTKATGKTTTTAADKSDAKTTTATGKSDATTTKATQTTATGKTTAKITPTGTTATGDTDLTITRATTATTSDSGLDMSDMPTLSTTGIPTYPAPTVPPTEHAPFMHHSKAPEGTVFIAVGAVLGAIGVAVLLWRAMVAYLLHRSVARAALAQHLANDKAAFAPPGGAPFYKYSDRDSTLNLGGTTAAGSASGRGVRRTNRAPVPSATPSQTNLFFSPTAAPGGMAQAGNRESRLLPSGFYAAGTSSPANASGTLNANASYGNSINMATLRPDSRGPGRVMGVSPPDSPSPGPGGMRNTSGSSLNLNNRPQSSARPPSAYLDDLLDDQQGLYNHNNSDIGHGPGQGRI